MANICENCGNDILIDETCECKLNIFKKEYLKKKRYIVSKNKEEEKLRDIIFSKRNIKEDIEDFFNCSINNLSKDKFLNEEAVVKRIITAIDKKEKIGIYGDYDADGLTGSAVAYNILTKLGVEPIIYVNDRFKEGFGLGKEGIKYLKNQGVTIIITVDNGIAAVEGVEYAKENGIEVIVTDHHEENNCKPDCLIINPKQEGCPYENKEITGAGVIFKILFEVAKNYNKENAALKQLDLVSLGLVCDMCPITGENRIMIKNGLKLFNWDKRRNNFAEIRRYLKINGETTTYDLGYIYGPLINAESRINGRPNLAKRFLIENKKEEIDKIAKDLIKLNEIRKIKLNQQLEICEKKINLNKYFQVIYSKDVDEGIAGLIASRLIEKYGLPIIVLGNNTKEVLKGSGRSIKEFNIKKALDKVQKFLIKYGGHEMACGLSVSLDNFQIVKSFLENEGKMALEHQEIVKEIQIDKILNVNEINYDLIKELEGMEPFGIGFRKPIFLIKDLEIKNVKYMKDVHSKFINENITFICFNEILKDGEKINVIGCPSINEFNGKKSIQFIVNSIVEEDQIYEN